MAQIENIIGITIFLVLSGVVLFLSFTSFAGYQEAQTIQNLNYYTSEREFQKLNTVLAISDIYSKTSVAGTIFLSFRQGNYHYSTAYGDVNINDSLKKYFDYFYGEGNYYFEADMNISSITINILYDNGKFMWDLKEYYNFFDKIIELEKTINEEIKEEITFNVYVLSNKADVCDEYQNEVVNCHIIYTSNLYKPIPSENFEDPLKKLFPEHTDILDSSAQIQTIYTRGDWPTFIANVSESNTNKGSFSNINMHILFSEAIPYGGASDYFFTNSSYNYQYYIQEQCEVNSWGECASKEFPYICYDCIRNLINKTRADSYFNYYCKENTNFTSSEFSLNRSLELLKENKDIVFPVIVHDNNAKESDTARNYLLSRFSPGSRSNEEVSGGNPNTICGKRDCPGCYENSTHGIFHNETRTKHKEFLQRMATETTGELVDFSKNQDLSDIISNSLNDTISRYSIKIGEKKEFVAKKEFSKSIVLNIEGQPVEIIINLETYTDSYYVFNDSLEFEPILNSHTNTSNSINIILSHEEEILEATLSTGETASQIEEISTSPIIPLYQYNISFNTNPNLETVYLNFKDNSKEGQIPLKNLILKKQQ